MAINYLAMRATATRLLKENGTKIEGVRPGSVERIDGEEVITDDTTIKIIGVKTEYKPHQIDGKNILSGDVQLTCTYETPVQVGDVFDIDGQRWRVENPWPSKPASILLCYKLQLRGV